MNQRIREISSINEKIHVANIYKMHYFLLQTYILILLYKTIQRHINLVQYKDDDWGTPKEWHKDLLTVLKTLILRLRFFARYKFHSPFTLKRH